MLYLYFSPNLLFAGAPVKTRVMVSIPPQTYFVERIGGTLVDVMCLLPAGASPHFYEPRPRQMKFLSEADMYVRVKIDFENAWWKKISAANTDMLVVDSTQGIDFIGTHMHRQRKTGYNGRSGAVDLRHKTTRYNGRDPHIWLSPRLVKTQVENICQGLMKADPEHSNIYKLNKEAFIRSVNVLDAEIRAKLANLKTRHFMVFHPTWAYFARDYNLEQIPIEMEGKEPSAGAMAKLMTIARKRHISVIFLQPQISRQTADVIAGHLDAKVTILDPLAADWMKNMLRATDAFVEILSHK